MFMLDMSRAPTGLSTPPRERRDRSHPAVIRKTFDQSNRVPQWSHKTTKKRLLVGGPNDYQKILRKLQQVKGETLMGH
jgi:hypothetical protein